MSVDRFAVTDFGILFHVDSVVHLDGRGGPILVGRVDGDGKLRVGDQLKFGTKGGDAVVRDGTVVQISNRDKQSWKSPWDDPNWRPGL
jgi:hypothetical protein